MKIVSKIVEILLKMEEKSIMREVSKDERVKDVKVPDEVRDAIFDEIRRIEEKREIERRALEMISSENKELIRLGRIYKNGLHRRKYVILAAILVLAMSVSITSFGGVDRMFHKISNVIFGRSRETIDTEGVKTLDEKEEEVFEEIEVTYGISPVRMAYLPEGAEFLEGVFLQDALQISILYGTDDEIRIIYDIILDYQEGSWSKDIEDELVNELTVIKDDIEIDIREFKVENREPRWLIQFDYENIHYRISVCDVKQNEIHTIIDYLCFSLEEVLK